MNNKINVGFIGAVSEKWMGGLNYYKNLLFALSQKNNSQIKPVVFLGKKTPANIKSMFAEYAAVIESSIFDKFSVSWFIKKLELKFLKRSKTFEKLFQKHNISVLYHTDMTLEVQNIKTISWIPDFQHVHLPEMFSSEELKERDTLFTHLVKKSDMIAVSSNDALSDLNTMFSNETFKSGVLQFVSQSNEKYHLLNDDDEKELRKKFNISGKYLYLPNQFWKHKNHITAFKAIKILKQELIDITLVCTGYLDDYRNSNHVKMLQDYITENGLTCDIRLLGLVDYQDVFSLIKFSEAVVNPSLFEGWSSTVEECKSVGKQMILSDINVHKEQYPQALFFTNDTPQSLANVIKNMIKGISELKTRDTDCIVEELELRTQKFADTFISMVNNTL